MSWNMKAAWVVRPERQLGKGQGRKPAADKGEHTRALLSQGGPAVTAQRVRARLPEHTPVSLDDSKSGPRSVQGD